jgi:hypothetical protein
MARPLREIFLTLLLIAVSGLQLAVFFGYPSAQLGLNSVNPYQSYVPQPFDFSITVSNPYQSVQPGQSASYFLSVNLLSGCCQIVSLSVSAIPPAASWSFSSSSGVPYFSTTLVITASESTPSGTYTLEVDGQGGGQFHSLTLTFAVVSSATTYPPVTVTQVSTPPVTQIVTVQSPTPVQTSGGTDFTTLGIAIVVAAVVIALAIILTRQRR